MKNKPLLKTFLHVAWYLVSYGLIQMLCYSALMAGMKVNQGKIGELLREWTHDGMMMGNPALVLSSILSSLLVLFVFHRYGMGRIGRSYLRTRPWAVVFWAACLALGTLVPGQLITEQIGIPMPSSIEYALRSIMEHPMGYLAVGVLAPVAEELCFRAAILRKLLAVFPRKWHWMAIVTSAVVFGAYHGNVPQAVHGMLAGLLLGWMYYRTKSIVPCLAFHWMNNSLAFLLYRLYPNMDNARLQDYVGGEQKWVWMALLCSLCIMIPSIFQLHLRMRPAAKA